MTTNKKALTIALLLLLISGVSIFPFFLNNHIYFQDDIYFHAARLENYYEAIKHLDFFPRVFPGMGNNYGYGADLFYPSILLLPFALFRLLGIEFVHSFFLYQFLISLGTAVICYFVMKQIANSRKYGLLFACMYTLSTYRLIDQSVRGALGETLAFMFLPLVLFAMYNIFYQKKNSWVLLAAGMSLLIASHLITAFYTAIIIGVFLIINLHLVTKKIAITLLKAILTSFLLSAWFFIPYFEQVSQIEFFFSKPELWKYGLDFSLADLINNSIANVGRNTRGLAPNFGIFLLVIFAVALLNYKKLSDKLQKVLLAAVALIVASTNLFFWSYFRKTFFAIIQFEWRLLIFVTLFGCVLGTFVIFRYKAFSKDSNVALVLLLIVGLAYSFNGNSLAQSVHNQSSAISNENYLEFNPSEIGHGKEYLVKGTEAEKYFYAAYPRINGKVKKTKEIQHRYKTSQYAVVTASKSTVQLPHFSYVGYQVFLDGEKVSNYEKDGLVTLDVPAGRHSIKINYAGTFLQKFSLILSILTIAFLMILKLSDKLRYRILVNNSKT